MRSRFLAKCLKRLIADRITREPDHRIGEEDNWYLLRWYIIPRNRFFNIYLHRFLRSDDDRALHDHPWWSFSICLDGGMYEITENLKFFNKRRCVRVGDMVLRSPTFAHRLELSPLFDLPVTLFITGPRIREWGFLCPKGWRHWQLFTAKDDSGQVGRGCE